MKKFAIIVIAGITNACAVSNNTPVSKTRQVSNEGSIRAQVEGAQSKALVAALQDAGVNPESINGRIPVGAVTLKAEALVCSIIQNQFMSVHCQVDKKGETLEVKDDAIAQEALAALKEANVAGAVLTGAINHEVFDIECHDVPGPQGDSSCSFRKSARNVDGSIPLSGDQASILFDALESTRLTPDNVVDGRPVTGATVISADVLHCNRIFDASMTSTCFFEKSGRKLGAIEQSMIGSLVDLLSEKETQVAPFRTGASDYRISDIKCHRTFGYPMVTECSFAKMY